MRHWFTIVVLLVFAGANAQQVSGRVEAAGRLLSGVEVLNIVNEKSMRTDAQGRFSIEAKPGEMLLFYLRGHEPRRFSIDPEHMGQELVIELFAMPEMLDEVVITYDINPESLGIVPKGQKRYTVAERRLYAAGSGPLDVLVNALSGKTAQRKKEVVAERRLMRLEQLTHMFAPEYFTRVLQIPELYVSGFKFFVLDHSGVISGLSANSKARVELHLTLLAPAYLETIQPPGFKTNE